MSKYKLRMWDGERESFGSLQTGLTSDSDAVDYRAGDDNPISVRKLTGLRKYTNITLKRGYTQDSSFAAWAAEVGAGTSGSQAPSHGSRRFLELSDEAGQPVVRYSIHGSSLTEHQLIPHGEVILHNLQLRDGRTVEEKLWVILEESLSRLKKG